MSLVHYRRLAKTLICFVIVAVLTCGFLGDVEIVELDVRAESISAMQSQINDYDKQMDQIQGEIDDLQSDIDKQDEYLQTIQSYINTVESKIMTCENLLATYDAEIADLNDEIAEMEQNMADNKELYKRRIRSIYMSGGADSDLLILTGSDKMADYLSTAQITESLSRYDKALIKKINLAMEGINKKIEEKNDAVKEQEAIKQELAAERSGLQSTKAQEQQVKDELTGSQSDLKAKQQEIEAAKADLEARVDAAYEAARQQALAGNIPSINYDGKGFAWPIPGYTTITSPFGMRFDPYYQYYRGHNGLDISGGGIAGKPIVASANGTVTVAEFNNGGYGNYVVISHVDSSGNLITTHYAHMMSYTVGPGQTVNQGDVIGYVGTTGASTGYHLHFEVRVNNTPVDPFGYVSY